MRGVPNNPVVCAVCGVCKGSPKDRLCHACRLKSRPNPTKKYYWTPELDRELMLAYKEARDRCSLTENLNTLQQRGGFPRVVILARAERLGLSSTKRRWTAEEAEYLSESAGTLTKVAIARKLRRSYWSVKARCSQLQISSRLTNGYSRTDVQYLLGVGTRSVKKWIKMGWVRLQDNRLTEASVAKFLRDHPDEYKLNRVDEAWFKGILFPAFGRTSREPSSRFTTKETTAGMAEWFDRG